MKVKLESFLQEISEKTTENDQHPVLTSSKAGLFLQRDYFNKQVASKDNTGYKIIRRGQFTYRAMSDTGEFFPNMLECTDIGIVSPAYPVFEITKQDIVIPEFLKYFFKSDSFQHSIAAFAQGSTRTSVKFGKMKTVEITLPSVPEQRHIVEVLDRAKTVIEVREQELQKLDELVNARFVEMFGDKQSGFKYPCSKVQELTDVCSGGTPDRNNAEYWEGGTIPWVKTTELQNNVINTVDEHITEKGLADSSAKLVPAGSILIAMYGQGKTRGMTAYLGIEASTNQACACILPTEKIDMVFMWQYFVNSYNELRNLAKGSNQANLNAGMIKSFPVPVPPIELQKQYSAFVAQVDKSKASNPTESGSTGDVTILFVVNQLRKKSR